MKTHEEALQAAALSVSAPIGVAQTIIAAYLEARGAVLCEREPTMRQSAPTLEAQWVYLHAAL